MSGGTFQIHLTSADATAALATLMAKSLGAGDVLLLAGDIGAGKTHFARALIQSLLQEPEDVPSPTFTLVQTYETNAFDIWHADLYRLTAPDEVVELGLLDAFEDALCLIEWPDRLAELAPENALGLSFELGSSEETRKLTVSWADDRWLPLIESLRNV
ncbi:tRNA (adenosine(37)-N6)-threonylcarbamoyltransferase complex ATPase subunit type 1 TsaE [Shimia litoralis]|uniref:tRNA threonylcarbamoyladenosine biosynthesis protein TsaE n=1 Tax=Shimia litoralis TaxID=420403 RepID=A0A4U7N1T6_9RHOB|nr:tRNA (adenosine(37)-N6)-threonylcarbamoyltransferase complex ATPase subunit type 1 TsaE [Shimia litoralis]TKZ19337.1 tRNA (adenosine(37)-N6)-threonylcarbamoyltransferase complex ATPase subunit type 1 TsaE [Shimia litoralis]